MRNKRPEYKVVVHDHFDGSSHCVECQGECQLKGAERTLTELIRWELEIMASHNPECQKPFEMFRYSLDKAGIDWEHLLLRAKETTIPFKEKVRS